MDRVQKNLSDLERKLVKANKIAAKGSSIKLGDAIKLGRKSNAMVSSIRKGIKEYDGAEPTDKEANAVLVQMRKVVDLTEDQLNTMVTAKPRFDELKVAGLVKRSIGKTKDAGDDLAKLMLSKAPANLKAEAEQLNARNSAAFAKAMAAYASAAGGEDQAGDGDDSDSD